MFAFFLFFIIVVQLSESSRSPKIQIKYYERYFSVVLFILLAPVVQTLDSAIHGINHYPADKY